MKIHWTKCDNFLIADVVLNGIPLRIAYSPTTTILGMRLDFPAPNVWRNSAVVGGSTYMVVSCAGHDAVIGTIYRSLEMSGVSPRVQKAARAS